MAAKGGIATHRHKEGEITIQYNKQSPPPPKLYSFKEQAQEDNTESKYKQLAPIPKGNHFGSYQTTQSRPLAPIKVK